MANAVTQMEIEAEVRRVLEFRRNSAEMSAKADKALFSARAAAAEAQASPHNAGKSRDVLLTEAIMAEFRRDPDLAKAWKFAPGTQTSSD